MSGCLLALIKMFGRFSAGHMTCLAFYPSQIRRLDLSFHLAFCTLYEVIDSDWNVTFVNKSGTEIHKFSLPERHN